MSAVNATDLERLCHEIAKLAEAAHPLHAALALGGLLVALAALHRDQRAAVTTILRCQLDRVQQMGDATLAVVSAQIEAARVHSQILAAMPLPVAGH